MKINEMHRRYETCSKYGNYSKYRNRILKIDLVFYIRLNMKCRGVEMTLDMIPDMTPG